MAAEHALSVLGMHRIHVSLFLLLTVSLFAEEQGFVIDLEFDTRFKVAWRGIEDCEVLKRSMEKDGSPAYEVYYVGKLSILVPLVYMNSIFRKYDLVTTRTYLAALGSPRRNGRKRLRRGAPGPFGGCCPRTSPLPICWNWLV